MPAPPRLGFLMSIVSVFFISTLSPLFPCTLCISFCILLCFDYLWEPPDLSLVENGLHRKKSTGWDRQQRKDTSGEVNVGLESGGNRRVAFTFPGSWLSSDVCSYWFCSDCCWCSQNAALLRNEGNSRLAGL